RLDRVIQKMDTSLGGLADEGDGLEDMVEAEPDVGTAGDSGPATDAESDDAVVRFINKTMIDAIRRGASDIHFEPYEKSYRVRMRIDGILEEVSHPPPALAEKLAARIKVISALDVADRRRPQDGRTKLK